jgi:hypothetical protein
MRGDQEAQVPFVRVRVRACHVDRSRGLTAVAVLLLLLA